MNTTTTVFEKAPHNDPLSGLEMDYVYRLGRAFVEHLMASTLVVGYSRASCVIKGAEPLTLGIEAQGCDVQDVGICSEEELSFAIRQNRANGGIRLNVATNPMGFQLFDRQGMEISIKEGLAQILQAAKYGNFKTCYDKGSSQLTDVSSDYVRSLLSIVHCLANTAVNSLQPIKVVVHQRTLTEWPLLDALEQALEMRKIPISILKIYREEYDGMTLMLPLHSEVSDSHKTSLTVISNKADFGVIIDGNTSNCRFIDENGNTIENTLIAFTLAKLFEQKYPSDPIATNGLPNKTEATSDNEKMIPAPNWSNLAADLSAQSQLRSINAVYGFCDEKFHYFRHLAFAKSAFLPWLLISICLSEHNKPISQL